MTDEQIAAIFAAGNAVSTTAGLRAVYEAGRNERPPVVEAKPAVKKTRKNKKKK